MRIMTRRIPGLLLAALGMLACDGFPTDISVEPRFSAAERSVYESLYDMAGSYFVFACSPAGDPLPIDQGELVLMEGKIFERITLLQKGNGEYQYKEHTMPVGLRGVGVDSGEEFRVTERDQLVSNQLLAGGSGMYRQELKLVGTETQRTFWMVTSGFYHINSDGEATVVRNKERIVCRPGN
jgi:hypothetical protein